MEGKAAISCVTRLLTVRTLQSGTLPFALEAGVPFPSTLPFRLLCWSRAGRGVMSISIASCAMIPGQGIQVHIIFLADASVPRVGSVNATNVHIVAGRVLCRRLDQRHDLVVNFLVTLKSVQLLQDLLRKSLRQDLHEKTYLQLFRQSFLVVSR